MYPEAPEAAPAADYEEPIGRRIGMHLEGLIPIALILIIGFFVAVKFGVVDNRTPVIGALADVMGPFGGQEKTRMLLLGSASQEVIDILNDRRDKIEYVVRTIDTLERNPVEQLADYDLVMLDQSEESNKQVSKKLGEALQRFVKNGGKLILVGDSAIRRPDTFDVIGWRNTFGDIIPVDCDRVLNNIPTCTQPMLVNGKLYRVDERHRIMQGIDMFPADPYMNATFRVLDVTVNGRELAYIQSDGTDKKQYPAIVEKNLVIGKVIYFNYNPGITRGIFESTLDYLK
ncbi:Uncharacterised protein [uncultured archaeon]|nr:Uncharacterised protein [uncultured archaeon]